MLNQNRFLLLSEILIFGTGQRTAQLPPHLRTYLRKIGIQTDVMDTVIGSVMVLSNPPANIEYFPSI